MPLLLIHTVEAGVDDFHATVDDGLSPRAREEPQCTARLPTVPHDACVLTLGVRTILVEDVDVDVCLGFQGNG
jgi:hypothetical protein